MLSTRILISNLDAGCAAFLNLARSTSYRFARFAACGSNIFCPRRWRPPLSTPSSIAFPKGRHVDQVDSTA
jgi:hypothetical protein